MSNQVQSLWSPQIHPRVLSPRQILGAQALELPKMTGGLLKAEIREAQFTETGAKHPRTILFFEIVAPSLNYRHPIMSVAYEKDMPYPAFIESEAILTSGFIMQLFIKNELPDGKHSSQADSDEEFVALLSKVLGSSQVVAIVQSILARATEALDVTDQENRSTMPDGRAGEKPDLSGASVTEPGAK
jgi:hypothetical protein